MKTYIHIQCSKLHEEIQLNEGIKRIRQSDIFSITVLPTNYGRNESFISIGNSYKNQNFFDIFKSKFKSDTKSLRI